MNKTGRVIIAKILVFILVFGVAMSHGGGFLQVMASWVTAPAPGAMNVSDSLYLERAFRLPSGEFAGQVGQSPSDGFFATSSDGIDWHIQRRMHNVMYTSHGIFGIIGTNVFRSTDDGATWEMNALDVEIEWVMSFIYIHESGLLQIEGYTSDERGWWHPFILHSEDGGSTWTYVDEEYRQFGVWVTPVIQVGENWVDRGDGRWVSIPQISFDSGETWQLARIFHEGRLVSFVPEDIAPTEPVGDAAPNLATASTWAHEDINRAFDLGLIPTALQNNYTQPTTRAEFAAFAVALYEIVTGRVITERMTFNDTTDINVQKMGGLGVVTGVGYGNFAPGGTLTREQAAVMLSRLANAIGQPLPQAAPTFADNATISSWAVEAIGQMQATGIMGGVGYNNFDPSGQFTREQSIITMLRMFDMLD